MPHLMNCNHLDEGWCLQCVRDLWEEKELAQTHVLALQQEMSGMRRIDDEARLAVKQTMLKLDVLLLHIPDGEKCSLIRETIKDASSVIWEQQKQIKSLQEKIKQAGGLD